MGAEGGASHAQSLGSAQTSIKIQMALMREAKATIKEQKSQTRAFVETLEPVKDMESALSSSKETALIMMRARVMKRPGRWWPKMTLTLSSFAPV